MVPTTSRSSGVSSCRCRCRPLPAFAIFQFLWVWNDLLVAYVFLGATKDTRVITIALANLVGSHGENWYLLTSAAFRVDGVAARRVLLAAAVLRPRSHRRIGQGMSRRVASTANLAPLRPQRKWRAITFASLLLAPAVWALLIGLVAAASDEPNRPAPARRSRSACA